MKVIYSDRTKMLIIEPETPFEKAFMEEMGDKELAVQWGASHKLIIQFSEAAQ